MIHIDKLLTSSAFIDDLDSAMSHWDLRSTYAKEIGKQLAKQFDINVLNTTIACARQSATITGGKVGGAVGATAAVATDADTLLDAIAAAAQKLDENDVAEGDRCLILKPAQYWLLINDVPTGGRAHMLNRDFTSGNGDVASGTIMQAYGFKIFKSNHIPGVTDALAGDSGGRADPDVGGSGTGNNPFDGAVSPTDQSGYRADFPATVGIAFHKSAVGTVKLLDLSVQSDYLVTHQGSLLVARYAMGHNFLRPEAAIELTSA